MQFCILWLSSSLCMPSSHLRTSVRPLTRASFATFTKPQHTRLPYAVKTSPISPGSGDVGLSPHFVREAEGVLGSALPGWALHIRDLAPILMLLAFLPLALTWFLRTACPAPGRFSLSQSQPSGPHAKQRPSLLTVSPREVQRVGSQAS